jgi:hypothetical protein
MDDPVQPLRNLRVHHSLDREVIQLPHISYALDKLGKLAERHSLPLAAVSNDHRERAGVRLRTEGDLSQRWQTITVRPAQFTSARPHLCVYSMCDGRNR